MGYNPNISHLLYSPHNHSGIWHHVNHCWCWRSMFQLTGILGGRLSNYKVGRYKSRCNPYKWPHTWVTGVTTYPYKWSYITHRIFVLLSESSLRSCMLSSLFLCNLEISALCCSSSARTCWTRSVISPVPSSFWATAAHYLIYLSAASATCSTCATSVLRSLPPATATGSNPSLAFSALARTASGLATLLLTGAAVRSGLLLPLLCVFNGLHKD